MRNFRNRENVTGAHRRVCFLLLLHFRLQFGELLELLFDPGHISFLAHQVQGLLPRKGIAQFSPLPKKSTLPRTLLGQKIGPPQRRGQEGGTSFGRQNRIPQRDSLFWRYRIVGGGLSLGGLPHRCLMLKPHWISEFFDSATIRVMYEEKCVQRGL